ncbi:hypothetical protein [Streptomyces sp. NPDC058441]|uniref:hypothetical protein n=1 Tax=Streptomyces sp. NPDC058441 TaxID=3346502 RepID=UPI0036567D86
MDTMSVNVATLRCATSVAGARESTRDFLEGLIPAIAAEASDTVVPPRLPYTCCHNS